MHLYVGCFGSVQSAAKDYIKILAYVHFTSLTLSAHAHELYTTYNYCVSIQSLLTFNRPRKKLVSQAF